MRISCINLRRLLIIFFTPMALNHVKQMSIFRFLLMQVYYHMYSRSCSVGIFLINVMNWKKLERSSHDEPVLVPQSNSPNITD